MASNRYAVTYSAAGAEFMGALSARKRSWGPSYHIYDTIALDRQWKPLFPCSSGQALKSSRMQRPIRVPLVYTCAILQCLQFTEEPALPSERRKVIVSKEVSTVIFLNGGDGVVWFVSKNSCKYGPRLRSDMATLWYRKSMTICSLICPSDLACKWTVNDARSTFQICPVLFSGSSTSPLPKIMYFSSGWFHLAALKVITLTSSDHGILGQLQSQRMNSFKYTGSMENLS